MQNLWKFTIIQGIVTNTQRIHVLVFSNCALCTAACLMQTICALKNHHPEVFFFFRLMVLYYSYTIFKDAAVQLHAVFFSSDPVTAHLISIRSSEPTYEAPSTTPCTIIRQSFFIIFGIHSLTGAELVFFDINGETRC